MGELISAPVAQQISAARFERDGRGCKSCREHHFFPHVAQLEGGAPLRTETVRVQILPWGPFSPSSPTSRGALFKKERLRVRIPPWGPLFAPVAQLAEAANLRSALCRCKSGLEHFWSMYRTSEPGLGANEISRHPLTGVQVLRAPPFSTNHNPQQGNHEMSHTNTQALIESLLTIVKILARNPDRQLRSSIRAP